jgi:hypothetical protein
VLAHYGVFLDDYFVQIVKALVFAKVIMIGAFLRIPRLLEHKPLIVPVLCNAFLFTVCVVLFDMLEAFVRALIQMATLTGACHEILKHFTYMKLGGALVIFSSFIPFFAFKELARVMGRERMFRLFFSRGVE